MRVTVQQIITLLNLNLNVINMVCKCQSDCFLKKFTSTVVSFTKAQIITLIDGKEQEQEVLLDDTILFPEGGGQLWTMEGCPTHEKAVHFVDKSLAIGEDVKQGLD